LCLALQAYSWHEYFVRGLWTKSPDFSTRWKLIFSFVLLSFVYPAPMISAKGNSLKALAQAKAQSAKGNFSAALKIYDRLLKQQPDNLDWQVGKAYALAWSDQKQEALKLFTDILYSHPKYADAKLGKARTNYWMGDYHAATQTLAGFVFPQNLQSDVRELQTSIKKAKAELRRATLRMAYQFNHYSFTQAGHGFILSGNYDQIAKWSLRGQVHSVYRFNQADTSLSLGATRWIAKKVYVGFDGEWGSDTLVLPNQAYQLTLGYAGIKNVPTEVVYRFADFSEANSHNVHLNTNWSFLPNWTLHSRYGLSFVNTALGQNDRNHSVLARLIRAFGDQANIFAGYAFGQESFDSGNPVAPLSAFDSHHLLAGGRVQIKNGFGADLLFDVERRSNEQDIGTFELGFSHTW